MYLLQPKQRKFLETINPIIVLVFFYLAMIARTTVDSAFPTLFKNWDILLPFIVYLGQRRSIAEGLTVAILTSHLFSLSSGAPIGFFVIHYLVLFFVARGLSYVIYPDRWETIVLALFSLSVFSRLFAIPITHLFDHQWTHFKFLEIAFGWVLNAFLGYFIYVMLEMIDQLTSKVARRQLEGLGSSV